jgi:uncharacterized membrane protein
LEIQGSSGIGIGMLELLKGLAGKPSHPPLTDASIGAYTAGVAMLVAGALGLESPQMAHGALLALSVGLLLAAPTAATGLLDWLDLPKGSPARATATLHLFAMVAATVLFALTWLAQRSGYVDGEVTTLGLILGIVAEAVLVLGGTIGGSLAYVYGVRVLNRSDASVAEAIIPGRLPPVAPADPRRPADGHVGRGLRKEPRR